MAAIVPGIDPGTSPGSPSNGIQFNNAGAFGASSNLTYSGGQLLVTSPATTTIPAVIKGFSGQTANLQEWRDSSGVVLNRITASGTLGTGYGDAGLKPVAITSGPYASYSAMAVTNYYNSITGYILGDNGGTFNLLDGNANLAASLSSFGSGFSKIILNTAGYYAAPSLTMDITSGDEVGLYLPGGLGSNTLSIVTDRTDRMVFGATGNVLIGGFTASTVGLTVKGFASQTANLQEWQNSSATVLAAISSAGDLVSNTTNGIKIGTATNQKLGFFNATPVVQQTGGAATATGVYTATEQTMLQTVYNALRTFGLLS
jgi:hypothetical protein